LAGGISKRDVAGIIGEYDDVEIRYCERCEKVGLNKILQERVYPPTKPNEPKREIPRDHDMWLQCQSCGTIYAKYEVKIEDKLGQFAEINTNPHDVGKGIVSLDNKKKLTPTQKKRRKQRERIEREKDDDIKRELLRGNTVEIIE